MSLRVCVERQAQYEPDQLKACTPDRLKKLTVELAEEDWLTKGKHATYKGRGHTGELVPTKDIKRTAKEKKARKTWAEIAKGQIEDKSEIIVLNKRNDSDEPNHMKAKRMSTLI